MAGCRQHGPHPLSGFCEGRYSKWSWNGLFPFLLQVSLFLQLKRIIPALWRPVARRCSPLLGGHSVYRNLALSTDSFAASKPVSAWFGSLQPHNSRPNLTAKVHRNRFIFHQAKELNDSVVLPPVERATAFGVSRSVHRPERKFFAPA